MLPFFYISLSKSTWETYFSGSPNTTYTGYMVPETTNEASCYINAGIAVNFNEGVIVINNANAAADLLIEDSFFYNCKRNYAGGIAFFRANGSFAAARSCCCKSSSMSEVYTGAAFFVDITRNVTTNFVTFIECTPTNYPSISTIAFRASSINVKSVNFSKCSCMAAGSVGYGSISYTNFESAVCAIVPQVYLIILNYTDMSYCNFANNSMEVATSVTAIYCCQSTVEILLSNTCFFNNVADYVTYYYRKPLATYLFRMVDCYVDRGYVECRDTVNVVSLSTTQQFTFLSSYICEAAYTPETDNRISDAAKTAAIGGGTVGGSILVAVGVWVGKKVLGKAATKAIGSAVADDDEDDQDYYYSTYSEDTPEEKEEEKNKNVPASSTIKDETASIPESQEKNQLQQENENSDQGDIPLAKDDD